MRILKDTGPYLKSRYTKNRNWTFASLSIGCLALLLGLSLGQSVILLIGMLVVTASLHFFRQASSYWSGIRGEESVRRILQNLDDSYSLINDVMIGDSQGNIDHVLLSPKGIFVLETKNYSGKIWCDGDYWRKKGRRRWYDIPSVSRQAKSNATRLGNLLREHLNLPVFVNSICVFTNPTVELRLSRPSVAALELRKLVPFLQQAPLTRLTNSHITSISDCILAECSKRSN